MCHSILVLRHDLRSADTELPATRYSLLVTDYFFDVADEECRLMAWMPWVIATHDQQLCKTDHNEECSR